MKDALDRVQAVRDAIAALEARLRSSIHAVAAAKATVGFRYEYSRLADDAQLLDFVLLAPASLDDVHALAIGGDLATLVRRCVTTPTEYRLVRYLDESTVTRKSAFA